MSVGDLRAFARRLERTADTIASTQTEFVAAAAKVVKETVEREIAKDLPRRRVAGGKVGASWRLLASGANPRALVKADGPLHLVNNDTKAHLILPKGAGKGRSGSGVHPLLLSNVSFDDGPGFAYAVHHPGTKGKRTWQHGVEKARPLIRQTVDERGASLLRSLLK